MRHIGCQGRVYRGLDQLQRANRGYLVRYTMIEEVVRTAAPFALTLYLTLVQIPVNRGQTWFTKRVTENLGELGVGDPGPAAQEIWLSAKVASEPKALGVRALGTLLAVLLAVPSDWDGEWVLPLLLLAGVLFSFSLANWLHPRAEVRFRSKRWSVAVMINVAFVLAGLATSILKAVY